MAKPKTPSFPAECCGVCKYSHLDEEQLACYVNPPKMYHDDVNGVQYDRGAPVEATDHACINFKGREHA